MKYLTNTFSPAMLRGSYVVVTIEQIHDGDELKKLTDGAESAISHEVTAKVLSALLGREIKFNRVNIALEKGDEVIAVIPSFRAQEAREFTEDEVRQAGFKAWRIMVD